MLVGLIAFSPLFEQTPSRDPLGFLAILPVLWAALRREPRDTAMVALLLAGITVWGTLRGGGPFTTEDLNVSFLLVLMFLISITVPSLLLSADVTLRKKAEENLLRGQTELERKVAERTHDLELANAAKSRFLAMASHDLRQPLHALGILVAVIVGCRRRGGTLRIEVVDTGPGIPEDRRERIFEEFYRFPAAGHGEESGVGLGLAIVHRLCRLLGHTVELNTNLGKGSRFAVTVPLTDTPAYVVASMPNIAADAGRRVIVIEDDVRALEHMAALLRNWGWHVVAANSREGPFPDQAPDLIISDYHLADGTTGIEAIERLRDIFKAAIPALLISGDTAPEQVREARAKGYLLLHKPVSPIALRATLNALSKSDHDPGDSRRGPVQAAL